ncbi:MAG: ExbD/TolR family protein [Planctomycetota bacterium]
MPKTAAFKRTGQAGEVSVNMTPMIDIVFQLIIFFILASQFASAEIARMSLPFPHNPDPARTPVVPNEEVKGGLIINVVAASDPKQREEFIRKTGREPVSGEPAYYMVKGEKFGEAEAYEKIVQYVKDGKAAAEEAGRKFHVEVRASESLRYGYAALALQATMDAGVLDAHLNVTQNPSKEGA